MGSVGDAPPVRGSDGELYYLVPVHPSMMDALRGKKERADMAKGKPKPKPKPKPRPTGY